MNAELPSQDNYRDEYKVISEEHRFFGGVRFITAAFALSIQSAMFAVFNQVARDNKVAAVAIFVMAIIFLVAVFIIERRTIRIFRVIVKRGKELEFYLGLTGGIFHRLDELSEAKGFATHTRGISLIYWGIFALWIILIIATFTK